MCVVQFFRYPAARPTVCIGLSCNPSAERLELLLQQLSSAYYKEPREVLLHALAMHVETFLVKLPSQPNLWEEMQQRVQQQQQQQQHLEQLQLQLMRDRARRGTLHKSKKAAAAEAAAAAAARDGDAATTQQQAAEFHMAVAARLRGEEQQMDVQHPLPSAISAAVASPLVGQMLQQQLLLLVEHHQNQKQQKQKGLCDLICSCNIAERLSRPNRLSVAARDLAADFQMLLLQLLQLLH
ncbi:uncharacterized protein EMH_0093920 [Eimeria mitis]|uniref:Uncharacterized protein n=1 Tax=Eimeria mitis TaxID=44415 RepID=U6KML8_9EIME|nr:uncharacterized protein EMH_0093920 [Eimeria mitis]CDJ36698.1 hypothetical protein, conserved [Eimeria mitis]